MATDPRSSIYFQTSLCKTLCDAVDDLISDRRLAPQIGAKILHHFIASFQKVFAEQVTTNITLKGHLDYYRNCDDMWLWKLSDCTVQIADGETLHVPRLRVAGCPSEMARMPRVRRAQMQKGRGRK